MNPNDCHAEITIAEALPSEIEALELPAREEATACICQKANRARLSASCVMMSIQGP
jgi:hypothetical protein